MPYWYILQTSVAVHLKCVINLLLLIQMVKGFWKLVSIWWSYGKVEWLAPFWLGQQSIFVPQCSVVLIEAWTARICKCNSICCVEIGYGVHCDSKKLTLFNCSLPLTFSCKMWNKLCSRGRQRHHHIVTLMSLFGYGHWWAHNTSTLKPDIFL